MAVQVLQAKGKVSVKLYGKRRRACAKCGESNPSPVTCLDCGALNRSGEPCRSCNAPGQTGVLWDDVCPNCGTPAIVDDCYGGPATTPEGRLLTAWYRNWFKNWWQQRRERKLRRQALKGTHK